MLTFSRLSLLLLLAPILLPVLLPVQGRTWGGIGARKEEVGRIDYSEGAPASAFASNAAAEALGASLMDEEEGDWDSEEEEEAAAAAAEAAAAAAKGKVGVRRGCWGCCGCWNRVALGS
jgi:hypothetical protein